MKYSKALIILTGFLVTTAATAFSQEALGVNYNQFVQSIQEQEVSKVQATWIRGFLDMHLLGNQDPSRSPDIQAILKAKAHGRRTVLNLKWNYETENFPTAGSVAMTQEVDQLNRVLPVVLGKVDILVIGNEPFIETLSTQSGQPLIAFYQTMADDVIGYWSSILMPPGQPSFTWALLSVWICRKTVRRQYNGCLGISLLTRSYPARICTCICQTSRLISSCCPTSCPG
jgi:hypothetical protein